MAEQPIPHFSFVVRCWRDASGDLCGWLVDVYTGQPHPFRSATGLVKSIERTLSVYSLFSGEAQTKNDEKHKKKGGHDK